MKTITIKVTDRQHANLTKAAAEMGITLEEAAAQFANSAEAGSRPKPKKTASPIVESHADPKFPEVVIYKHADGTGSAEITGETRRMLTRAAKASGKTLRQFFGDLLVAKIEEEQAATQTA